MKIVQDLVHLIYPNTCIACDGELATGEHDLCFRCAPNVELTYFHLATEPTVMDQLFWGRVPTEFTHAHFHFKKNATAQKVLFNLKYKHNSAIGERFGNQIGKELLQQPKFQSVDYLIPVPLHPKKEFIRGYNQSLALAKGIADITDKKVRTDLIKRIAHTTSQTKKSRFERWDNVNNAFRVKEEVAKANHILLVDDVITTGSTIEQLIQQIHAIRPEIKVSVVTLAIA